jgi:hypothetical protein
MRTKTKLGGFLRLLQLVFLGSLDLGFFAVTADGLGGGESVQLAKVVEDPRAVLLLRKKSQERLGLHIQDLSRLFTYPTVLAGVERKGLNVLDEVLRTRW